ncbi:MAG: hypothetical protein E7106_01685 [Prevotella sp.]|nr:hypothetical protein [Prevotella sp.]
MMEETKRCPYCGEEILAVAKKCKHCGEWLETKESEKEKKACPVCGEQIDVDVVVCPYCKELTHFKDSHQESILSSQNHNNPSVSDDRHNIFCKNCKASLSIDADACPNCGDKDPFYFKRIKRIENITSWVGAATVLAIQYFAVEYMGLRINLKPEWLGFVFFMIVWFILWYIFSVLVRRILFQSTIKDYEEMMQRLFDDIGDSTAIERWRAKVDDIL